MIFAERSLTFREFAMSESVPLSAIQEAVLQFLCDRDDAAIFGAQAVNAYVDEPRMSQDVDILALNATALAEAIRMLLNERFNIAVRLRAVANGRGYRIYQVRKPRNRHLVDVRLATELPPSQRLAGILVPLPAELISQKIISMVSRSRTAKGMTDVADVRRLLLTFPDLKSEQGAVLESLQRAEGNPATLAAWHSIVAEEIECEDDDAGY